MSIEKYRTAGTIAQSGLLFAIQSLGQAIGEQTIGDVCRATDDFLRSQIAICYKSVEERGIALPTEICKNEMVSGLAPEVIDTFQGGTVFEGDVVKITLGVFIDGYTAQCGHTIVIREGQATEPYVGLGADAAAGAFLATEAVLTLLSSVLSDTHPISGPVTPKRIKTTVEQISNAFGVEISPGSRVRRVRRFVIGQPSVDEKDAKVVQWHTEEDEEERIKNEESWEVLPGETYLVDIQFASGQHKIGELGTVGYSLDAPDIYTRDFTITSNLRSSSARQILAKTSSVYPFKLSYYTNNDSELRQARLGANECVKNHLFIPSPRLRATSQAGAVILAREMSTIVLVKGSKSASGFPEAIRLGGGKQLPPAWIHSTREPAGMASEILESRRQAHTGVRYIEVAGRLPRDRMTID